MSTLDLESALITACKSISKYFIPMQHSRTKQIEGALDTIPVHLMIKVLLLLADYED